MADGVASCADRSDRYGWRSWPRRGTFLGRRGVPVARDPMPTPSRPYLELSDRALLEQCVVTTYRASGPGGQKRNKTDSAVRLKHGPTGLIASASESRLQQQNRARALVRLRQRLASEVREELDLASYRVPAPLTSLLGSTESSRPGRHSAPYVRAAQQLLDVFVAASCSVADTARLLGSTTGQVSRLLLESDWVAREANRQREAHGLKRLRAR